MLRTAMSYHRMSSRDAYMMLDRPPVLMVHTVVVDDVQTQSVHIALLGGCQLAYLVD